MNYFAVFFIIGFVILFHELGHFFFAHRAGVPIQVFSVGFGPKIWSRQCGVTEYRISLIPFGGYVLPALEDENDYFRLPVIKRISLAAGGPIFSLLLPLLCLSVTNVVVNGFSLSNFFFNPLIQTGTIFLKMVQSLPGLFSHPGQLSGVIGIVAEGGRLIGSVPLRALQFTAFLSINLAMLNLLPLPVLDGGKILLAVLEKIHPATRRLNLPLAVAGWAFVAGLMLYTTFLDLGKYVFRVFT